MANWDDFLCFRYNSRGFDLNRNFPDYFKPHTKREQPETEAVRDWLSKIQFVLSGSLHGGALVSRLGFCRFCGFLSIFCSTIPDSLMFLFSWSHF